MQASAARDLRFAERPAGGLAPLPVTVASGPRGDFRSASLSQPSRQLTRSAFESAALGQTRPASTALCRGARRLSLCAVHCRAKDEGQPSRCGVLLCIAAALLCLVAAAGGVTFYVLRHKSDAASAPNALTGTFINPVIPGNFADPFVLAR